MNKYENFFYNFINKYKKINDALASLIIESMIDIPEKYKKNDDLETIFSLLHTEYRNELIPILLKYGYNFHCELQYILANLCNRVPEDIVHFQYLPSINDIVWEDNHYEFNTKVGKANVYPINFNYPELAKYIKYAQCHTVCEEFIRDFNGITCHTGLISRPFVGGHYHSFIQDSENNIFDLSHGVKMSREDYQKLFNPCILNTVTSENFKMEEERILQKENLGKLILLNLAVEKQFEQEELKRKRCI